LLTSSVRNRLFAVIAGMALLASLSIGVAYVGTEADRLDVQTDRRTADELADVMTTLIEAIHEEEVGVADYLLSRDLAAAANYQQAREVELRAQERISFLTAAEGLPDIAAAATALAAETQRWRRQFAEPALTAVDRGSVASIAAFANRVVADQDPHEGLIDALKDSLNANDAAIAARDDFLVRARLLAGLAGVGVMLLGAVASAVLLRRWVSGPLSGLLRTAARVEAGEDTAFVPERHDEIGALGMALERMRLTLHGDAERSGVLNRFTEVTTFAADDTAVARSNLEALRLLVNPDGAVTHVLNRSKDRAIPEASLGSAVAEVLPLNALSNCPGIVRGSIYVTPDVRAPLSVRCPVYPVDHGTVACVPLAHGENVGAVHLAWDRTDAFPLELRASVTRIAEHAALAIANRRLLAALQGMASTDARTGLANTRAFDQALENELAARRPDETVAVMMLDLDHFKDFNDRHGHPAGDEALRAFADILRSCLRDGDLAARYGGEEFAIVLPTVDEAAALMVAERIRSRTESSLISLGPGITDRMTVSIGLATAPAQGNERLALLRLADEALYRAKEGGRNRVEYIGDPAVVAAAPSRPRTTPPRRRRRAS
jgi:diguanylate cyclase (GGDEF)-like protein